MFSFRNGYFISNHACFQGLLQAGEVHSVSTGDFFCGFLSIFIN